MKGQEGVVGEGEAKNGSFRGEASVSSGAKSMFQPLIKFLRADRLMLQRNWLLLLR